MGLAQSGTKTKLTSPPLSCVVRSELIVWMQYTEPSVCTYCTCILLFYFTGESLFSSFFPLESSPFFLFLFARSWGSLGSSGMW